jgi:hypothetical protein
MPIETNSSGGVQRNHPQVVGTLGLDQTGEVTTRGYVQNRGGIYGRTDVFKLTSRPWRVIMGTTRSCSVRTFARLPDPTLDHIPQFYWSRFREVGLRAKGLTGDSSRSDSPFQAN